MKIPSASEILSYKMVPVLMAMVAVFVLPIWAGTYILSLVITLLVYITLVGAWNIMSGYTGYLFLGAATFYGLGAYIVALTEDTVPYLATIPLAGAFCCGVAFLIGVPLLRIRGAYFIITTYALSVFLSNTILYYEQTYSSTIGRWITVQDIVLIYIIIAAITFLTLISAYLIKNSRFGYGLLAIKGNEEAAEMMGVNTFLSKNVAFSICALFMGLIGAASIALIGYVDNTIAFDPIISFNTLIFSIVGGSGSIIGGVISASIFSLAFEIVRARGEPFFFLMGLGAIVYIIIFYLPGGIGSLLSSLRRRIRGAGKNSSI